MADRSDFIQTDRIIDHVFPVVEITEATGSPKLDRVLGTGFFVGESFGLTARHVLSARESEHVGILMNNGAGQWHFYRILEIEPHPFADVTIFKVADRAPGKPWKTIFELSGDWQGQTFPYRLFGYPEDVMYEIVTSGIAQPRPDLVYTQGYVRRRLSKVPLPMVSGEDFYELSARAGGGYSGGPVISMESGEYWKVFGVYVGERVGHDGLSVGYATRLDALAGWSPTIFPGQLIRSGVGPGEARIL